MKLKYVNLKCFNAEIKKIPTFWPILTYSHISVYCMTSYLPWNSFLIVLQCRNIKHTKMRQFIWYRGKKTKRYMKKWVFGKFLRVKGHIFFLPIWQTEQQKGNIYKKINRLYDDTQIGLYLNPALHIFLMQVDPFMSLKC